jgi:cleavage and polyadenylation specificity factor subunit 2
MNSRVPLSGAELDAHLEDERLAKEREANQQAALDRSRRMLEADDLDTDSESAESEIDPTEAPVRAERGDDEPLQMSFDIFVKGQQMREGGAGEMARFRMFPFIERRGRKVDSYGEGIDVGLWVRRGREIERRNDGKSKMRRNRYVCLRDTLIVAGTP